MKNAINWFEIPVNNLSRAKKFYSTIFNCDINDMPMGGTNLKYAVFPFEQNGGVGGVLVEGKGYEPTVKGSLLYLNGGDDLSNVLSKVEKAGGKIVVPKTSVGPYGFIAHFKDSEGNKVGLHSRN